MKTSKTTTTTAARMCTQMRREIPWLSGELIAALGQIAQGNVVVPSLELDQQLHALCLNTRVYTRLCAIMTDHIGHGFEHRPCCGAGGDETLIVKSPALTPQELVDYKKYFDRLMQIMHRLEDETSPVNLREMPVGVYSKADFAQHRRADAYVL